MDGRERLKDFAARSLLLKLESRGLMKLPALRVNYRRDRPQVASLDQWEQPADWTATLAEIAPVVVENVQRQLFFPLGRIIVVVQARTVRRLEDLLQTQSQRTAEDQKTINREVSYFQDHREHLQYQQMEKAGTPMGSGAVESLGKQLQGRLRGCGQFWTRDGLTSVLRLAVLVKNNDYSHLWN